MFVFVTLKTAYDVRISDGSSDVCSSDLQSPKSEFYNTDGVGTPFHQGVTDFGSHFPTHRKFCSVDGRSAVEGDILVSVRAPVGRLNLADTTLVIGRGIAAIRSRSGHQNLLFEKLERKSTRLNSSH